MSPTGDSTDSGMTSLSDAENEIYNTLISAAKDGKPPHLVVVITDLAKDYDDLMAMVLLAELHRLGLVKLEAFVANLRPAKKRARFGRGALDLLGLKEIPIAVGSKGSKEKRKVHEHEFKHCSFMAPRCSKFETGKNLLLQVFQKADEEGRKITLVLLSSLMDIWKFADKHSDLFKRVVDRISMQGGMFVDKGTWNADPSAANNSFALDHAKKFTEYIQKNNIPTIVFTKVAALHTRIGLKFLEELAATGHPLGIHLRDTQLQQDEKYYEDSKSEKTRFKDKDQKWFITTKTTWVEEENPVGPPYPTFEQLKPYLIVVAYDALAALGAVREDVLASLEVLTHAPDSPICRIVGVGKDSGIKDDKLMTDTIKALMKGSLLRTGNITSTSRSGILKLLSLRPLTHVTSRVKV